MHTCETEYDDTLDGYRMVVTQHIIFDKNHRHPELNISWRCGYVRLPKDHPFAGQDYGDLPIDCHGGLTYSNLNTDDHPVPRDNCYWIGFDCNHFDDNPTKCSVDYCKEELLKIIEQLKRAYER